jgi:hypothetical protein
MAYSLRLITPSRLSRLTSNQEGYINEGTMRFQGTRIFTFTFWNFLELIYMYVKIIQAWGYGLALGFKVMSNGGSAT